MATLLEKDLIRESAVKINDREIIITISTAQTISMKLKGMKSGTVSIPIEQLYQQLTSTATEGVNEGATEVVTKGPITITTPEPVKKYDKESVKGPMISLNDLRSQNAIADLDYPTKAKFDGIISNLLNR